ncbi:MAG: diguanylate cyclase [Gammaproteobacteria bacterium]|nr:diguanylate cyclase [Gammaproteobacteria bacterium]MDH3506367.1 diguanylate cyclase [Gammaproteobacteria bacterium]
MTTDRWERCNDQERAQLRGFARSIAEVEWLLLVVILVYLFVAQPALANPLIVIGALGVFVLAALILRYTPRLRAKVQLKITLEILAMVGVLTVVLSQVGGETSALVNFYLLPVIAAAMALGTRATLLVTALVCVCYLLLATVDAGLQSLDRMLFAEALGVLVPFVLIAFLTGSLAENIRRANRRIRSLADRDELTKLLNIGAFMRLAERAHKNTARTEGAYSILLVDVDHLKKINDSYGHEAGNRALRVVAEALLRVTRSEDLIARFGGDEFIALLANSEVTVATDIAQRLRSVVYAATFEVNMDIVRVQVSVGVANYPLDGETLEKIMAVADRAMYADKELRALPEGQLVIQKR